MAKKAVSRAASAKGGDKTAPRKKKAGAKGKGPSIRLAAPTQYIQVHTVNGNPDISGMSTQGGNGVTIVGFVKPAGATVDCQLYTSNGAVLNNPRQVVAAQYRWSVSFTNAEAPGGGVDYLFEGNLDQTSLTAYVSFRLN